MALTIGLKAFVVLTDANTTDHMAEDRGAIQRAIAIRRQNPTIKVIVQLLLHKNKHRLYQENVDIFCVEEVKFGLLGRSIAVRGLSTLV